MGKERPRPRWNRTEDGKRWINKTPRKVNDDGWMTVKGSDTDKTPVVDIRGLAAGVTRPDLVQELQGRFGHNIVNVLMLQDRALVEYEDQTGSSNLVTHAARNQVYIFDQPVTIQYSKFQKILTNPPARMTVIRFTRQQSDDITEAAVLSTMQRFGTVTTVVMKLKRGLAHVEYEDMTGSGKAVTYAEENQLYVSGHPVSISYGKDEIISVSPSRTVFVRFRSEQQLVDAVTKMEVVEAMDVFGTISNVNMMLHKGWALVKYEDTTGSAKAVNYAAENQVYVSGLPVSISYSSSNVVEALTSPRVFILFRGDKKVDEITEAVLVAALEEFGTIKHVVHMNAMKRHAIVEYEDLTGSANAVSYAGKNQVYISGHPVVINYSRDRQRISKTEAQTLPSPVGEIRDVVDGISALIGRIEGTNKPTRLNVSKNDQDTWDYTNPNRGGQDAGVQGNRNNSPYPNANPNKRPRQPTYPGDRPPRYGGP